MTVDCMILSLF